MRAGDCIVHVANTKAHTLRAGDDGLDVLVFGQRVPVELCNLPAGRDRLAGPALGADDRAGSRGTQTPSSGRPSSLRPARGPATS